MSQKYKLPSKFQDQGDSKGILPGTDETGKKPDADIDNPVSKAVMPQDIKEYHPDGNMSDEKGKYFQKQAKDTSKVDTGVENPALIEKIKDKPSILGKLYHSKGSFVDSFGRYSLISSNMKGQENTLEEKYSGKFVADKQV